MGEGREGRGREGGRHITRHGGKSKGPRENVMRPNILLLSLVVNVGWQEWRQEAPPPSPAFPPFILSPHHSLLMTLRAPPPLPPFLFPVPPLAPSNPRYFPSLLQPWFVLYDFPSACHRPRHSFLAPASLMPQACPCVTPWGKGVLRCE